MVKCPVLDEFALKLFDTERAVNIKLSQQTGLLSVPWATMLGEVNIPEPIPMDSDLARIGIVWEKEGQVKLPKKKLHSLLCTRSDYRCLVITFFHIFFLERTGCYSRRVPINGQRSIRSSVVPRNTTASKKSSAA